MSNVQFDIDFYHIFVKGEGGALAAVLSTLTSLILVIQEIIHINKARFTTVGLKIYQKMNICIHINIQPR